MKRAAQGIGSAVQGGDIPPDAGDRLGGLPPALLAARPVAVVGAGPAGVAVAQGLINRGLNAQGLIPEASITGRLEEAVGAAPVVLIGDEADAPYNRVRLTPFLAGETEEAALRIGRDLDQADATRFARLSGCRVTSIDPQRMVLEDAGGDQLACSSIVLATGSRPVIPPIPGTELAGVHCFRTLSDARNLERLAAHSKRAVVIGGGLLGLEAARGLVLNECPVSVVEHSDRLMSAQLDGEAALRLMGMVEAHGVDVHIDTGVVSINGEGRVQSVSLGSGETLDCDLVVVAVGVRPNTELAAEAGLDIHHGIVVDRHMRTSAAGILAVGECAEQDGRVQGLAGPALAQARVAADTILGQGAGHEPGHEPKHEPGVTAARLKIFEYPVFSIGSPGQAGRTVEWSRGDLYRQLTVKRGRVVAAAGIGDWPDLHAIQRAVSQRHVLWPWQAATFRATGRWGHKSADEGEAVEPASWAPDRIICNCTQTTCAQLRSARASGCQTVESLQQHTGASRVCGSCHDLVSLFADTPAANTPIAGRHHRWQLLAGLAFGAVMAVAFLPGLPAPATVDSLWFDLSVLWRDGGWRQVTGYSLLVCLVLMMGFSASRRVQVFRVGNASFWRWFHAVTGVMLLVLVGVHTGLSWGGGLTSLLLTLLLAASVLGALAGGVGPEASPARRRVIFWAHLFLVWPLPVLLGFHILSVYWF